MRRSLAVLLCSALLAGCGIAQQQQATLAERADDVLGTVRWCTTAARLSNAVARRDLDAVERAAAELQGTAPDALSDDVAVLLAAAERGVAGDLEAFQDPRPRAALERLRATISDGCDPR